MWYVCCQLFMSLPQNFQALCWQCHASFGSFFISFDSACGQISIKTFSLQIQNITEKQMWHWCNILNVHRQMWASKKGLFETSVCQTIACLAVKLFSMWMVTILELQRWKNCKTKVMFSILVTCGEDGSDIDCPKHLWNFSLNVDLSDTPSYYSWTPVTSLTEPGTLSVSKVTFLRQHLFRSRLAYCQDSDTLVALGL